MFKIIKKSILQSLQDTINEQRQKIERLEEENSQRYELMAEIGRLKLLIPEDYRTGLHCKMCINGYIAREARSEYSNSGGYYNFPVEYGCLKIAPCKKIEIKMPVEG